jgi:MoaA/NifB/PqqE/SkfB family radical SAM enzyme
MSSPDETEALDVDLLLAAIIDAAGEGYDVLAVSGSEPLLYRDLPRLIRRAKEVGMTSAVTTNGTLLDDRRLAMIGGVDLLAISLDGVPASHDRMRGARSFERMSRRLDGLRASGIRFGFIFTLTMQNLDELEWVAEFALAAGASLLQVHPLELAGRGLPLGGARPDEEELQWAVVEASRVQTAVGPSLTVHVDAVARGSLTQVLDRPGGTTGFAGLVDPLVIESDGSITPVEHGFDRSWSLGSLHRDSLATCVDRFRTDRLADLEEHVLRGAAVDAAGRDSRFVNWHEAVGLRARAHADAC